MKYAKIDHYIILGGILGIGLVIFIFLSAYPNQQFFISIVISSFYFLWGILHHKSKGDLHPKIVVEYLLIALLSVLLIRGAIYR